MVDQSKMTCTEQNISQRSSKKKGGKPTIDDEFQQSEDGGIKLDGEIVILAYDDVV